MRIRHIIRRNSSSRRRRRRRCRHQCGPCYRHCVLIISCGTAVSVSHWWQGSIGRIISRHRASAGGGGCCCWNDTTVPVPGCSSTRGATVYFELFTSSVSVAALACHYDLKMKSPVAVLSRTFPSGFACFLFDNEIILLSLSLSLSFSLSWCVSQMDMELLCVCVCVWLNTVMTFSTMRALLRICTAHRTNQ